MVYTPKEPIKIRKSFSFQAKEVTDDGIPHIKIRGYASKMLDTEGKYVIDADQEHINAHGIGLKRLKSGNLPLLFGHDQNKAIGKITGAVYKQDGLEIEATVYKLKDDPLTNYVYEAVKAGILNSFSVGILVHKFDMIEQDGEDYLQLAESELIETSIVAVPSNNLATFSIMSSKGIGIPGASEESTEPVVYKTILSKQDLKLENPGICGEFETCVLEATKGLTYEETRDEGWHKSEQFRVFMSLLVNTLEDNFYANRWDELSAQQLTENIESAFTAFMADQSTLLNGVATPKVDVDELNAALAADGSFAFAEDLKSINGDNMHTKDTTPEPVVQTETTEPSTTEEVTPPVATEEPQAVTTEPVVAVEDIKEPEVQIETTAPKRTADDFVVETALLGANIDKLEVDDLAKYYDAMSNLLAVIEDHVKTQVHEEAQASA